MKHFTAYFTFVLVTLSATTLLAQWDTSNSSYITTEDKVRIGGTASPVDLLALGDGTAPANFRLDGSGSKIRLVANATATYFQIGSSLTGGSSADLFFTNWYNHAQHMAIKANGQIGIGTTTPSAHLHVLGTGNQTVKIESSDPSYDSELRLMAVTSNNRNESQVQFKGRLAFAPIAGSALMTLFDTGQLGIGTNNPISDAKLMVNGSAYAEEIIVDDDGNWPDYVFEDDYDLMPLSEVEAFIEENGHLPGIKSAEEYDEAGGVAVGELQMKLLEKIEELTLHMIEQQKRNDSLAQQVAQQQESIGALKAENKKLRSKLGSDSQ